MSDDTMNGLEDCPRCGSLLPDPEEGVCMTCGYEYGRETLYMPVVTMDKIRQVQDDMPALAAAPEVPAFVDARPAAADGTSNHKTKLIVAFVAISILLMVVLVAIGALLLY